MTKSLFTLANEATEIDGILELLKELEYRHESGTIYSMTYYAMKEYYTSLLEKLTEAESGKNS